MTRRHRNARAAAGLILAGTALGGLTLWLVRRQGEPGAKLTELQGPDSSPDSWLPDDVLDLPSDSSAPVSDRASDGDTNDDDELADIFDRPRT